MKKALHCPFCGSGRISVAMKTYKHEGAPKYVFAYCCSCKVQGPDALKNEKLSELYEGFVQRLLNAESVSTGYYPERDAIAELTGWNNRTRNN